MKLDERGVLAAAKKLAASEYLSLTQETDDQHWRWLSEEERRQWKADVRMVIRKYYERIGE